MKLYNRLPKEMEMIRSLTTSALWRSPKQWEMNDDPDLSGGVGAGLNAIDACRR